MAQRLDATCELYKVALDVFRDTVPDAQRVSDVEVIGSGAVKVWYEVGGERKHWSRPVVMLLRDWGGLHLPSETMPGYNSDEFYDLMARADDQLLLGEVKRFRAIEANSHFRSKEEWEWIKEIAARGEEE